MAPAFKPCPLQLIKLYIDEDQKGQVSVNEEAVSRLADRLKATGVSKVAVVSVMGAFRTGKSFILDLFLRYLRYEAKCLKEGKTPKPFEPAERGSDSNEAMEFPEWLTEEGECIEGNSDADESGFRFRGGMDCCTEGIWCWSEPFVRTMGSEQVALILMDTQGAWDGNMTKEQSATIFGLTAVLSSKQIYNINMQIQEDKVENLAFFMRFAQSALRQEGQKAKGTEGKPFQSLDFLVRDWRHFDDELTTAQCVTQMGEHLGKFCDPKKVRENSTAEALQSMFDRIGCYCLPHPGRALEKKTWSGSVKDIDGDFVRFVDKYCRQVFTEGLAAKSILGAELSCMSFPMILKDFVKAFKDASPVCQTFTQAMEQSTVLVARERAMVMYSKLMDDEFKRAPRGMKPEDFDTADAKCQTIVKDTYNSSAIFGSDELRAQTWTTIQDHLKELQDRYKNDNRRAAEKALVGFANWAILGVLLFVLDRVSDFVCDWWSQTCAEASRVMLLTYGGVCVWIGFNAYRFANERGRFAAANCFGELYKEMITLSGVYFELVCGIGLGGLADLPDIFKKVMAGKAAEALEEIKKENSGELKKDK